MNDLTPEEEEFVDDLNALTQEEKVAHIKEMQKELRRMMDEHELSITRIKNDDYKPKEGVTKAEAIKAFQTVLTRSTELYDNGVELLAKAGRGEEI